MAELDQEFNRHQIGYCLDCGKCSSVCPVTLFENGTFTTPRLLVARVMAGDMTAVWNDPLLWQCLTCQRCTQLCPADVHFLDFMRGLRTLAREKGEALPCTHGDMIPTWGRMMADPDRSQNRLGWLSPDLAVAAASDVSADSDTLFFSGCMPYFDVLFHAHGYQGQAGAQGAVRLLNTIGITPKILADERCCGHDHLWSGDTDTFRKLARLNLEQFKAAGIRRIITACPECARSLKIDYPRFGIQHGLAVQHILQVLAEPIESGRLAFRPPEHGGTATFHDPCRLGRHLGIYDPPRQLLQAMGYSPAEMPRSRNRSLCCGTSCWLGCGKTSKAIQTSRLEEAVATGAGVLMTACGKCQIHLQCAQKDFTDSTVNKIQVRDLIAAAAQAVVPPA